MPENPRANSQTQRLALARWEVESSYLPLFELAIINVNTTMMPNNSSVLSSAGLSSVDNMVTL